MLMALQMHPSLRVRRGLAQGRDRGAFRHTTKDLAKHFGVSRQALSTLLNGHSSISADMIRFEKAFGIKADTLASPDRPMTSLA
jgi:transcriptional regulator with XRE-family HTH domain